MMAGVAVAAIDQTMLATVAVAISSELGDIEHVHWLFTASLFTSAASMLVWGSLGDHYGRQRTFQAAVALFLVASLMAAQAESMIELIVCRAVQGVGTGALLTLPYAMVGDIVSPQVRPAYLAFITAVWSTLGVVGPPVGGVLVEGPGWRWLFYLGLVPGVLSLALIHVSYRLPRSRTAASIDLPGAFLITCATGALTLYTSWAGDAFGYSAAQSLSLLVLGVLFFAGFLIVESRSTHPIVNLGLVSQPAVWPPLLVVGLLGFSNVAVVIFLPMQSILVSQRDAIDSSFTLMPLAVGIILSGVIVGRRASRDGRYRRYATVGLCVYSAGLIGLLNIGSTTSQVASWACSLALGMGTGAVTPIVVSALQNAVPASHIGVASSLPSFIRSIAQTFGTAALGAFLMRRARLHIDQAVTPPAGGADSLSSVFSNPEAMVLLDPELRAAASEAFRDAFSETFLVILLVTAPALVAAAFVRDHRE